MVLLQVKNLSKRYGNFVAVDGVDFCLEQGEIFGLLGPNGAGKTTTINMLTGLARPTAGSIELAGVDCVRDVKAAQHLMGIVPDESNLYEELSGFENLVFCASLYGLAKARREARARELLARFGLASAGDKPFKAYSKGMKRKLTIAAGIIHEPEILFLDEPSTGIDVESTRHIRALIRELNAGGTTVLLTTHQIDEAEKLCQRVAFMVSGKVVRLGTVAELIRQGQQDHILQFQMEGETAPLRAELAAQLQVEVDLPDSATVRVRSAAAMPLMPFLQFFTARGMEVYEAKIIRPSLEDVFVKATGVGLACMRGEKEGGRR